MKKCWKCKRELPDSDFYPYNIKHKNYICRQCCCKTQQFDENIAVGGWHIIILNHPKCTEYRFQAYNTVTGEFFKSNESEKMKIFFNVIIEDFIKKSKASGKI